MSSPSSATTTPACRCGLVRANFVDCITHRLQHTAKTSVIVIAMAVALQVPAHWHQRVPRLVDWLIYLRRLCL